MSIAKKEDVDSISIALLLFAGLAGGTIAALAGGAAIITFPILLAVSIPPVSAAATNTVAIAPGSIIAAITERSQLPPLGRSFISLVIMSVLATLAGGALLAFTPEADVYQAHPAATRIRDGTARLYRPHYRLDPSPRRCARRPWFASLDLDIAWLMPVSAYGGYFGAGLGVMILAVLSIGTGGDYRSANVTKNLVMSLGSVLG